MKQLKGIKYDSGFQPNNGANNKISITQSLQLGSVVTFPQGTNRPFTLVQQDKPAETQVEKPNSPPFPPLLPFVISPSVFISPTNLNTIAGEYIYKGTNFKFYTSECFYAPFPVVTPGW